jgi:hypothetical protein
LAAHFHRCHNFSHLAIFPIGKTDFVRIINKRTCTSLKIFIQTLEYPFQGQLSYLQAVFFWGHFSRDNLVRVGKNKSIYPASNN